MPKQPDPTDFTDEEMNQIQRHGAAQMGDPSFSEEVEQHLQRREEASAQKMRAAMTGGGDLGPSEMEQAQVKQTNALQQQTAAQGAQKAQQAQSQMAPIEAPEAPGGAAGQSKPYPAQAGPQPAPPAEPPPPMPPPQQPPGPGDGSPPAED